MLFWTVARKDIKTIFRDRTALIFMFGMPLIFTVLFGFAFSGRGNDAARPAVKALVTNQDTGAHGAAVVEALKTIGLSVEIVPDADTLRKQVSTGNAPAGLVIPPDFSAQLDREVRAIGAGETSAPQPALEVQMDPAQMEFSGMMQGSVIGAVQRVAGPLIAAQFGGGSRGQDRPLVKVDIAAAKQQAKPSGGDQILPGFIIYFVFFLANSVAITLIMERQEGTLRRMLSAPISRLEILFGKLLARAILGVLQTLMILVIGKAFMNLHIGTSLIGVALLIAITIFAACGLGLLIATFGKTVEQIQGMTTLALIVMGFLSGCLIPRTLMPPAMQTLSKITPHAWALDAYQDMLLRHLPLSAALPEIGVVLLFGLVFFGLAFKRFQYE